MIRLTKVLSFVLADDDNARNEVKLQQQFEQRVGAKLGDYGKIQDPELLGQMRDFLAARRERLPAQDKGMTYLRQMEKDLIAQGVEPGAARARADSNYTAILNGSQAPASITRLRDNQYENLRQVGKASGNPFTEQLLSPKKYGSFEEILPDGDLAAFKEMSGKGRNSVIKLNGWASIGKIPAGEIGNTSDLPLTPELAKGVVAMMRSTGSGLLDTVMPGTISAEEAMKLVMKYGGIRPEHLIEHADMIEQKIAIDRQYLAETNPRSSLASDPGEAALYAAQAGREQEVLATDRNSGEMTDAEIAAEKLKKPKADVIALSSNENTSAICQRSK